MLFVRRDAVGDGFDESLIIGEDVDLVWRLRRRRMAASATRPRPRPGTTTASGCARSSPAGTCTRAPWACSPAAIPRALPAMWMSAPLVLPWVLLAAGRRRAALGAAAAVIVRGGWRLRRLPETSPVLAGGLVARGLGATGLGLARAIRRAWAPPLLLAARRRAWARRALLAAFATAIVQDAVATRRLGPAVADVPVRILDEAVAAVGTWDGCLRERTLRPLLPTWLPPGRAGPR